MSNEVTENPHNGVPDHLRQYSKAKIGNVDTTDLVIPRVKLLQALSPELTTFEDAKAGKFWHTIANQIMGAELMGVPIVIRKSYILWAPRDDDRGILARAMDGIHWDPANAEFTVKPKGSPGSITYRTKATVAESGLDKFGSSIPGDSQSKPAASLTYNMLWYFPEYPELSPSVIINTRSSVKPMQQLLSRIDAKPVAHYVQMYAMSAVLARGAEGPYFNYNYAGAGYAPADVCQVTEELFARFKDREWQANEESADTAEDTRERVQPNAEMAGKF